MIYFLIKVGWLVLCVCVASFFVFIESIVSEKTTWVKEANKGRWNPGLVIQKETFPETSSSHLKMDGWKTIPSFCGPANVQVLLLLVSGSVVILRRMQLYTNIHGNLRAMPPPPENKAVF